eukprot:TRINITY_DN2660_c0_g1_i1.p3 TRINITY_DN2660_c0_g1~~TRINITY_DN2660_c0_g1_i1.p3  ORF type:complete len:108 (+),score=12.09 TRINITY_DN2660_c0_g1_i1:756-1079(+)
MERGDLGKMFMLQMLDHKKQALIDIIYSHIAISTCIYSDVWKAYDSEYLGQVKFGHKMVNHSIHFKDPAIRVHTNMIESMWREVKAFLYSYGMSKEMHDSYLLEYMW